MEHRLQLHRRMGATRKGRGSLSRCLERAAFFHIANQI